MRGLGRMLPGSQVAEWHAGLGRTISVPGRALSNAFDARNYDAANLVAWYSATAPGGLGVSPPSDGSTVATWVDLSGNSRSQTVSGTVNFRAAGFGSGIASLEFATNAKSKSAAFTHPQSWTAYAVAKHATNGSTRGVLDGDNGSSARHAQYLRWTTDTLESIAFNTGGSTFTATKSGAAGSALHVVVASAAQGGNLTTWVDNVAGTPTATSGTLRAISNWLGINSISDTYATNTHYGEVVLYGSAHDATTRQAVQAALAASYGITLS